MDAAAAEHDPKTRLAMLAEVEKWLFTEEIPLMPLCNYVTVYMYDPSRLGGIAEHPRLEQDISVLGRRAGVRDGVGVGASDGGDQRNNISAKSTAEPAVR